MGGQIKPASKTELPGLHGYHPYDSRSQVLAVGVGAAVVGFLSVVLRLASRRITRQKWWWDDWMILFSGAWSLSALGLLFAMRANGLGLHADVLDPEHNELILRWIIIAEILYAWSLAWTKLSVLLLYYRVFHVDGFRKQALIVGGAVLAWAVCITFLFIFTCVPVEKFWHPEIEGRCISQVGTYVSNGVSTIITDVIILLMPAPQIWALQMRRLVKIGLCASFGLGGVVVVVSSYRIKVLLTVSKDDLSYTLAPTVCWTAIELAAGFVSANLPTTLPIAIQVYRAMKWVYRLRPCSGRRNGRGRGISLSEESSGRNKTEFSELSDVSNWPLKSNGLTKMESVPPVHMEDCHDYGGNDVSSQS